MTQRTVADILQDLTAANADLERLTAEESRVRGARTSQLNRVNHLQRELDKAIAEAKNAAPSDSDWWRTRQPKFPVG